MKITSIKQQVKNPERVSVFIDGKYSFSLSLGEVVSEKIKNGQELDQAQMKRLKKISEDGKLKARALNWLLGRPHSTREFKDYMYKKKAEPNFTEQLIREFTEKKYIDDKSYAEWLVDVRQRVGKSNRAITAELFKKGINRETIAEVLNEDNEKQRLKVVVIKKRKLLRYREDPQKLAQYLIRQGFNYQLVKEVLSIERDD